MTCDILWHLVTWFLRRKNILQSLVQSSPWCRSPARLTCYIHVKLYMQRMILWHPCARIPNSLRLPSFSAFSFLDCYSEGVMALHMLETFGAVLSKVIIGSWGLGGWVVAGVVGFRVPTFVGTWQGFIGFNEPFFKVDFNRVCMFGTGRHGCMNVSEMQPPPKPSASALSSAIAPFLHGTCSFFAWCVAAATVISIDEAYLKDQGFDIPHLGGLKAEEVNEVLAPVGTVAAGLNLLWCRARLVCWSVMLASWILLVSCLLNNR